MKNKLMASALVLGFTIAPTAAFALSVTTTQGGTPIYSCPQGTTKQGTNCITPATTKEVEVNHEATTYTPTDDITTEWVFGRFDRYNPPAGIRNSYLNWSGGSIYLFGEVPVETHNLSCPNGGTLNSSNLCEVAAYKSTETVPVPESTSPATISGSNGGSLIASVTGFLSPVWDFIQSKLLPVIAALVIIGISVRLSIKAVRKFSKVA